jgi:DNA-binding protein YbaB
MGNLANLGNLMKQAKKLQEDLERAQAEIAQLKVEATA